MADTVLRWKRLFNDLKAFKKEHGHCNVPMHYQPNPTLGYWVNQIRVRRKRGELSREFIRRLDALGFCWARWLTWEQHIRDLTAFEKKHGHCNVPMSYRPKTGLGIWVPTVRQRRKLGTLAKDRIRQLDALGFCWVRARKVQVPWEQRLKELRRFHKAHRHCNVPYGYAANPGLARWVSNLRQFKKHGRLTKERVRILDGLGFCWVRLGPRGIAVSR